MRSLGVAVRLCVAVLVCWQSAMAVAAPLAEPAFLAGHPDRADAWPMYQMAERVAIGFVPDRWPSVVSVRATDRALWTVDGAIEIPAGSVVGDDQGVIFHELFHGAFHVSALHAGADEAWGEAFADAFRYVMERRLLNGPTPWSTQVDQMMGQPAPADPIAARYTYPATLILAACASDLDQLRALFLALAAEREGTGRDVLSARFGYAIPPPPGPSSP